MMMHFLQTWSYPAEVQDVTQYQIDDLQHTFVEVAEGQMLKQASQWYECTVMIWRWFEVHSTSVLSRTWTKKFLSATHFLFAPPTLLIKK